MSGLKGFHCYSTVASSLLHRRRSTTSPPSLNRRCCPPLHLHSTAASPLPLHRSTAPTPPPLHCSRSTAAPPPFRRRRPRSTHGSIPKEPGAAAFTTHTRHTGLGVTPLAGTLPACPCHPYPGCVPLPPVPCLPYPT